MQIGDEAWLHEPVQFCMLDEPDCNDHSDCLRQECQIGNWSIGVHIVRIEIRLFQPWAKIVDFNMFGKLPSPSNMLHIFVIVPARSGTSRLMSHVGAGSNMQCFTGRLPDRSGSDARSLTSLIRWSADHVRPQNQDCDNRPSGFLLFVP